MRIHLFRIFTIFSFHIRIEQRNRHFSNFVKKVNFPCIYRYYSGGTGITPGGTGITPGGTGITPGGTGISPP